MACSFEGSSFFERRLCGRIALRVRRPGLLARQVQPLEQAREPPLAVVHPIGSFDMLAQISQAPGAHPIALRLRPAQDVRPERRLLTRTELLRATGARPVVQAVGSLSIEALDRIVQSLTLHAGQPRGLGPCHTLKRIGDGQQPQGGPAVLLMGCRERRSDDG
jgi:hypothetical protein